MCRGESRGDTVPRRVRMGMPVEQYHGRSGAAVSYAEPHLSQIYVLWREAIEHARSPTPTERQMGTT